MTHGHYFIIGIKGMAMSNIAVILKKLGNTVTGYDVDEEFPTDIVLNENSITWTTNTTELPEGVTTVVFSAAHKGIHNLLIAKAKKKNIPVIHQAELIGELLSQFKTSLAVAGCHGKTTTSSLLTYALLKLGEEPSYLVGAPSFNSYPGSAINKNNYFVIEADEYAISPPDDTRPKLHFLKPTYSLITNVDFDHPDVYASLADTQVVFQRYCEQIIETYPNIQCLILCGEDKPLMEVAKELPTHTYITYGFADSHSYSITNIEYTPQGATFDVRHRHETLDRFSISLFGEKNILNAGGVISLLHHLGFEPTKIKEAIQGFIGAKRRFERVAEKNGTIIIDDYAHHPVEIKAVINAARKAYPEKNIVLLFQPHTYSRTHSLKEEFIQALSMADHAIVLPIFGSARETMTSQSITSQELVSATVQATNNTNEAISLLKTVLQPESIVITAGAGDVYKLKDDILSLC